MKKIAVCVAIGALCTSVSACGGGGLRGPSNQVINRVLTTTPGAAQPSAIVSTELAYARAAKEQGFYSASLEFAAPGALLHGRNGPVPFAQVASGLNDPDAAAEWGTRVVVKSCDGAIALSQGRFVDAEGFVGNYVTAWVRQPDGAYRWTYDVAGRDDPQPPPRRQFEDGDIVVTALDTIRGLVATCPRANETIPPPPAIAIGEEGRSSAMLSSDGTLRWQWEHREDGTKFVKAEYFYNGVWETAIEESLASPPEG